MPSTDDNDTDSRRQSPQFTLVPFGSNNVPITPRPLVLRSPPAPPPISLQLSDEFSRCIVCFKNAANSTTPLSAMACCTALPNKHLVHGECAPLPTSFEEDFNPIHTCNACNGAAPVPYYALVATTKTMISTNTDLRSQLVNEKAFVTLLKATAVDDKNQIKFLEGQQEAVRTRERAVQEREEQQKHLQANIDARLAALVAQEQELKASEAAAFVKTQMAARELRCANEIKARSDNDVREAAHVKAKYDGLMAGARWELDRLKEGAPKLGAPRVTRKYGKGSCVFCGYYYCATLACGVCTTKYMEGGRGEVGQISAEGLLEAIRGAGYTGFRLADIESIPVKVQQLLYTKLR
jgi:hypothetical protein